MVIFFIFTGEDMDESDNDKLKKSTIYLRIWPETD